MIESIRVDDSAFARRINPVLERNGFPEAIRIIDFGIWAQVGLITEEAAEIIRVSGAIDKVVEYGVSGDYFCPIVRREVVDSLIEGGVIIPEETESGIRYLIDLPGEEDVFEAIVEETRDPDRVMFQVLQNGFPQL